MILSLICRQVDRQAVINVELPVKHLMGLNDDLKRST